MKPKKTSGKCIVCGHETTDKSHGGGRCGTRRYWHGAVQTARSVQFGGTPGKSAPDLRPRSGGRFTLVAGHPRSLHCFEDRS